MRRNGSAPNLRVLISGPAADELTATLGEQPTLALVSLAGDGQSLRQTSPVDVALYVVASPSTPDVVREIEQMRNRITAPLILAAYGEPNGIVETGLAVGAADVLTLPQSPETLMFALRKAVLASGAGKRGKVLTVFSPKGGSGKTVVSTNVAVAAAQANVETLLVDLDLQFGDAALALGVSPRATITDLAGSSGEIDADKLKAFVSPGPLPSLGLLAAPTRPEEAQIVGQSELKAILSSARGMYGAVVIDTGPLFDAAMLAALDCSDHLLVVANPEITSLKNVRIGLETIDRLGFPHDRVSIVVNRVGAPGGVELSEIEQALEAEIAYELPDDAAVPAALNRAMSAVLADDTGRFARAIASLGRSMLVEDQHQVENTRQRRFLVRGRR